mmetsp:Transcript_102/g.171  ORF Transcript_102/g.171 Transcript_102/m.171 type:complete len:96 (+) Transcript_102:81-368(+)
MFALLSAKFISGAMALTKFTSEADEADWQASQNKLFEKAEFLGTKRNLGHVGAKKSVFSASACLNATDAKTVMSCMSHQAISTVPVGGNVYTGMR